MNSSADIPLVKYNPGNRIENIYRLYTGNNYSTNGSKIPQIYIDHDNKKIMINRLSKELATRKKVGFYIKDDNIFTLCEFLENGNIVVNLEMSKLISIEEIQEYLRDKLNNLLLKKIKLYLEQSGYDYILFNNLYEDNVEIIDIKYEISIHNNIAINLKKYINCLSSIFNVHKGKLEKTNDIVELTYKRVSSYKEMDSINAYMTISHNNHMLTSETVERLQDNFGLDEREALKYLSRWRETIVPTNARNTFETKKIKVESNPGFSVEIKNLLIAESSQISSETNIEINNINNIKYIYFIEIFIDSLLKIILNPNDDDVKKICKGEKIIEVELEAEIKNKTEKKLTEDVKHSSNSNAIDNLFSDTEDDEDDYDEEDDILNRFIPDNIDTSEIVESEKDTSGLFDLSLLEDDDPTFDDEDAVGDDEDAVGDDEDDGDDDESSIISKPLSIKKKSALETKDDDEDDDGTFDLDLLDSDDDEDAFDLGELSETEGGAKLDVDLEGLAISGANNLFMKRLRDRDEKLFLTKSSPNFNSYSKSCPWQFKKQPIVLTKEEKNYIDQKDKASNSSSYDEYITYGSGEKKHHYICPRFWCIRDDDGQGRSLSLKDVNDGVCGGWDAVIPENSKRVPKGKRIFEFTDKRFRKSKSSTKNPLVYKPLYPGFKGPKNHPDGLCVPCCFERPAKCNIHPDWKETLYNKTIIYVKKDWIYTDGQEKHINTKQSRKNKPLLFKIKEGWYDKNDTGFTQMKKPLKDCPSIELETYMPVGPNDNGPSFDRDGDGNIIFSSINKDGKGKKQTRYIPTGRGSETHEACNQKGNLDLKDDVDQKKKAKKKSKKRIDMSVDKGPLLESFPLTLKQTGYLSLTLQRFLGYNSRELCQIKSKFKSDKFCLIRLGINQSKTQSFLSCIAFLYHSIIEKKTDIVLRSYNPLTLQQLKNIMIKNITLDKFISVYNGILPNIFKTSNKVKLSKYKNTNVFSHMKKDMDYLNMIASSYENFQNYLLDNTIVMNYEYLWDFICQPISENGLLFENGINLLIFNTPLNDITSKIELICPRIDYSQEIYNKSKDSILLFSKNNFYEPICQVKQTRVKKKEKIVNMYLNNNLLVRNTPEVVNILYEIINENLKIHCKPQRSLNTMTFEKNNSSYEIISLLSSHRLDYDIINQIVNSNNQVIALILKNEGNNLYLPVLPSSINKAYPFESFRSKDIYFDYINTISLLKYIYITSNENIKCLPKYKIVSDGMISGVLTNTNQFVPVKPIDINSINDVLPVINNDSYLNIDLHTMDSDKRDIERYLIVKKIKLETNFYNMFRNTFKLLINKKYFKEDKLDILNLINDVKTSYLNKLKLLGEKIKSVMKDDIEFVKYKLDNLKSLETLVKCLGLTSEKCKNNINCSFSKKDKCVLLLPKMNLLNNSDNENIYYIKLADEITRFPQIKKYMFMSKSFLSFEVVNYNLTNEEIILLEDVLLNKYFEDLIIMEFNEYIKNEHIYETVNPTNHMPFKTVFNMTINTRQINNCIYDPIVKLSLSSWDNYLNLANNEVDIYHYKQSPICTFQIVLDIINNFLKKEKGPGKEIDIITLKKDLFQEILNLKKNKETENILKELFRVSSKITHKKNTAMILDNNSELETHISSANYFITEIDMYLLFMKYKINAIMILKHPRYIFPVYKTNMFNTIQNEKNFYLITANAMQTRVGKDFPDKATNSSHGYPRYGLVYMNNNMSHAQKYFRPLIAALDKKDLKKLLTDFSKEEIERQERKRENLRKSQRKFRKKASIVLDTAPTLKKIGTMKL